MSSRIDKVQDLLHREIANLLIKDLDNPILSSLVTISGVRVSKDLRYSEIFFTSLDKDVEKIEKELNKASSYMRSILAKKIHLKRLPSLKFTYDKSFSSSYKIESLLDTLSEYD
tara:strand:- start:672 stop:1013 length:342 start_codon:yes stop_codon:yes gene_type:complete